MVRLGPQVFALLAVSLAVTAVFHTSDFGGRGGRLDWCLGVSMLQPMRVQCPLPSRSVSPRPSVVLSALLSRRQRASACERHAILEPQGLFSGGIRRDTAW